MNNEGTGRSPTTDTLAAAEQLIGISFTEEERETMVAEAAKKVGEYAQLRSVALANSVPPAFTFDPRLPRTKQPARNPPRHYPPLDPATTERPANLEDAAFYSISQLATLIRTRQATSLELTEMYLARLEQHNPALECAITLTTDLAIAQARQADSDIAQGRYRGPLHGIPWGAKDLLAARGYPTTWGATPYKEQVIDLDATVVERLAEAGAVLVAKLALGELAHGDQWFGGKTKNPWDIREGSGGSSSGPAAAVSAGLVAFAIGSETTGSLVWPALRCGASGLRPTFGRVPRHGAMILSWTLDKLGPIARTVEDCGLILTAIYGPDGQDPYAVDAPFTWQPDLDVRTLRIGYVKSAFDAGRDGTAAGYETVKAVHKLGIDLREHKENDDATLQVLQQLGVELIPIELPDLPIDPLLILLHAEAAAAFDELTRTNQDDLLTWQDEGALPNRFHQARFIPAVEYIQANRIRTLLMEHMATLMDGVDAFVAPQLGANNLTVTNLTGHPCLGLPNGFTEQGMPTGINLVGRLFDEGTLLTLGRAVQDATGFHHQHPSL
jgi:Asp-tRNA(Asn)/Glu-tRNA(Gln) amidotransferase A subunit family amidase